MAPGATPQRFPPTCDAGGALQLHKHAVFCHLLHGATHHLGKRGPTQQSGWHELQDAIRKGDMAAQHTPRVAVAVHSPAICCCRRGRRLCRTLSPGTRLTLLQQYQHKHRCSTPQETHLPLLKRLQVGPNLALPQRQLHPERRPRGRGRRRHERRTAAPKQCSVQVREARRARAAAEPTLGNAGGRPSPN